MQINQAASKIQAHVRGFFAIKKYKYHSLSKEQLRSYNTNVPGNDPNILNLPRHRSNTQVALVATSGVRSVHIACELGGKLPKIFLIDNSRHVIDYWRYIQREMKTATNKSEFFAALTAYTMRCVEPQDIVELLVRQKELKEDIRYYTFLFENYGFSRCKSIILNTSVIPQSWEDVSTFRKIKNICIYLGYDKLYAYASNIASYLHIKGQSASARKVLENIQLLEPNLAIHSDLAPSSHGPCCHSPVNIVIVKNHKINFITHKLGIDLTHPVTAQKSPHFNNSKKMHSCL